MFEIVLPKLGEGIDSATIAEVCVDKGQGIEEGDDVFEVVTDKAVFSVESETSGKIKDLLVSKGDVVKIGAVLALVETSH